MRWLAVFLIWWTALQVASGANVATVAFSVGAWLVLISIGALMVAGLAAAPDVARPPARPLPWLEGRDDHER